jgi:hypothetical protein
MSDQNKNYWLVTAPKTKEDTYNTLKKKLDEDSSIAKSFRFPIPELKGKEMNLFGNINPYFFLTFSVGTLDTLMSLSDDLVKIDASVENVTRKVYNQFHDLLEAQAKEENNNNTSKATLEKGNDEALTVNNCRLIYSFQIIHRYSRALHHLLPLGWIKISFQPTLKSHHR